MQAQLTIHIDPSGIQQLRAAGQFITIAHQARGPAGPAVTWLAIEEPFVTNNVGWDPNVFAVYMTNTLPFPGETIQIRHSLTAKLGWTFTFDGAGFFGVIQGPADVCTIINQQGPNLFFGLAYLASVNLKSIFAPIHVAQLRDGMGELAPGEELSVFLAPSPESGTVRPVPENALKVKPNANVVFDNKTSTFRT